MNRIQISIRIEELKRQNDKANSYLQQLEIEKNKVIQDILVTNGRILELNEMIKEDEKDAEQH